LVGALPFAKKFWRLAFENSTIRHADAGAVKFKCSDVAKPLLLASQIVRQSVVDWLFESLVCSIGVTRGKLAAEAA